jgi:protein-S-isoprenylcysteine O-methyltransferase Ste14
MAGLVPVLAAILARRFIAPEEARMKQSFGNEYARYAGKTRRWV